MIELPPKDIQESIFEAISLTSDGIGIYDADDVLVFCNDSKATLFGLTAEQAVGMTFAMIVEHAYITKKGLNVETDDLMQWLAMAYSKRRKAHFRTFEVDTIDNRWFLITEQLTANQQLFVYCSEITEKKNAERELKRLSENLFELATTDSLTHVYNRRHFYHLAEIEINRCVRAQSECSLLLMDIDHFKAINDNFGHAVGDSVLTKFCQQVKAELRSYDVFGRVGGEEFALLLPDTSKAEGLKIAERILLNTAQMTFSVQQKQINITVSIGLIQSTDHSIDQMMKQADSFLYQAKQQGRNCVIAG